MIGCSNRVAVERPGYRLPNEQVIDVNTISALTLLYWVGFYLPVRML